MSAVRFAAMGSVAHVVVSDEGGPDQLGLLDRAQERLVELETQWSRFIDTSEISRLNAASGSGPQIVGADTFRLVELAVLGWERTAGRFDPTVHDAVVAAGYNRWAGAACSTPAPGSTGAAPGSTGAAPGSTTPAPGCAHIMFDSRLRTIELPPGVRFDPGGIGKGLAADIVSAELLDAGAVGCLVNIGGDLRVRGQAPDPAGWIVDIAEPALASTSFASPKIEGTSFASPKIDDTTVRAVLVEGAIATSTTEKRTWQVGGRLQHHLIDPSTGEPHHRSIRLATAITRDAWWAEVQTKQLFGLPATELDNLVVDAAAMVVDAHGTVHRSRTFGAYEHAAPQPTQATIEIPTQQDREGVPRTCLAN